MTATNGNARPTPVPQRPAQLPLPMGQPRLCYVLLGLIILMFVVTTLAGGSTNTEVLVRFGAKVNVLIAQGEAWRLLSSMFLHVGLMHLAFNCYALFVLGVEVERLYGSARFLVIYLLAGLWGGLISFAFGPNLSAGASGAIFGLLGAMVAYFRLHRRTLGSWGRERLLSLLGVVGVNLVLGFTVPGIDNLAHLGGLASGAVLGWFLAPKYTVRLNPSTGGPQVVDTSNLLSGWWVILLAIAMLVGGTGTAMSIQRQSAPALVHQGRTAWEQGDPDQAETLFQQALSRDPHASEAYFYLGVLLADQGRMQEAVDAYQSALRLEPELAEAHWNLALAYVGLNQRSQAIQEFESFITLRPESPDADKARSFVDSLQQ